MTTQALTLENLKAFLPALRPLVLSMTAARAWAIVESKRVNAYIMPLFATFTFLDEDGALITDPDYLFKCDDEALVASYFAACDAAHREHGFTGETGCCPALIAEAAQIKAENAVLDALGDFLGQHISYSMRKQALELCCQLALARE